MTKKPIKIHIALTGHTTPAREVREVEYEGEIPVSGGEEIISEGREGVPHQLMVTRQVEVGDYHTARDSKA